MDPSNSAESAVLAAAIRLHDVTNSEFCSPALIDGALEDYRLGHPELPVELNRTITEVVARRITHLLVLRAQDRGEIGSLKEIEECTTKSE